VETIDFEPANAFITGYRCRDHRPSEIYLGTCPSRRCGWEGAGAAPYGKWYGARLMPKMAQVLSNEFYGYGSAVTTLPVQFIPVYDIPRGIRRPVVASINALLGLITLMLM